MGNDRPPGPKSGLSRGGGDGADERAVDKSGIKTHKISRQLLNTAGLIEKSTDQKVADHFTYLSSLK